MKKRKAEQKQGRPKNIHHKISHPRTKAVHFQWLRNISEIISVIVLALFLFSLHPVEPGKAAFANVHCCLATCQETLLGECSGEVVEGFFCKELSECHIGCCVDEEGYCYDNYLRDSCTKKGSFYPGSCLNNLQCTVEKPVGSAAGDTGIPIIYHQKDLIMTEPAAVSLGMPILIKVKSLEPVNYSNLTAIVKNENYSKEILLFDDGWHGDSNAKDGLFAGVWSENNNNLNFTGFRNMLVEAQGMQTNFIVSSSYCLPLISGLISEKKSDIIFTQTENTESINQFFLKAQSVAAYMLGIGLNITNDSSLNSIFSKNDYDYYLIEQGLLEEDPAMIRSISEKECTLNNSLNPLANSSGNHNLTNFIINLNPETKVCQQEGSFISLNPAFYLMKNNSLQTQEEFLDNFCSRVITEEALKEELIAKTIPPTVQVTAFSELEEDNPNITISFILNDNRDAQINYTIYYDLDNPILYLAEGLATAGQQQDLTISVPDGEHILVVQAVDSDSNYAVSSPLKVKKSVREFYIEITSLERITYLQSPNITFTIHHLITDQDNYINYQLNIESSIDATEWKTGTVEINLPQTIPTNINPGEYTIYITANDSEGYSASSLPYYIEVGTDQEPMLIAAYPEFARGSESSEGGTDSGGVS
ncbi:hypothetical protein HYX12_02660 [Candidatus Woesearchaeota archaeon]|nr:hypothetical protein [Candidatus Woesearchaeota archaeon]